MSDTRRPSAGPFRILALAAACTFTCAVAGNPEDRRTRVREPVAPEDPRGAYVRWAAGVDREAALAAWIDREPRLAAVERASIGVAGGPLAAWERWALPPDLDFTRLRSRLEETPEILHAEPERVARLDTLPRDEYVDADADGQWDERAWGQSYPNLWGLEQIGAEAAWARQTGSVSVVVAVVDSGIDPDHEDLAGNLWANPGEIPGNGVDDDGNGYVDDVRGWDFAYDTNDPTDRFVHGTHVAGVIAARGDNDVGIAGVSWRAALLPVKAFDDAGAGTLERIAAGVVYAADQGADIINMSFSLRGEPSQLVRDAVEHAASTGALLVAAGGNSGRDVGDCSTGFPEDDFGSFPACFEKVIGVGATDRTGGLAGFSNFGPGLDTLAPGGDPDLGDSQESHRNILSLKPTVNAAARKLEVGTAYYRERGTSLAAAYVSGALALAKAERPDLHPWMLRAALRRGAHHEDPAESTGPGRLDLNGLLDSLDPTVTSAPELIVERFTVSPRTLATGAPVHASVRVRNVGPVAAFGLEVLLRESDGQVLHRWPVRSLTPGQAKDLETYALVTRRGPRTFEVEVNPDEPGVLPEFYRGNNVVARTIEGVFESYFRRSTIVSDAAVQANPDIGARHVVWEDHRWGEPQIVSYEFATGVETRRTFDGEYHVAPAIAAGKVAWQDLRADAGTGPGTWDVRYQNLASGVETDVTDQLAAEIEVDAHREWLVWTDSRNGLGNADVYAYRWLDGTEIRVTENDEQQETPAVWRHRVVWEDFRSGTAQIHLRNLFLDDERALTSDPWAHKNPRIWNRHVVYEDFRDGNWDIVLQDVRTGAVQRLTDDPFDQFHPDVTERYVVWQDAREIDWDIWMFDRASGDARKLTTDRVDQRRPRIYGNRVVFGTFEAGDQDIGMVEIVAFPVEPIDLTLQDLGTGVNLTWSLPSYGSADRYRIYRSRLDRTRWTLLGESTDAWFVDDGGDPAVHRWAVTAVDSSGGEGPAATIESP